MVRITDRCEYVQEIMRRGSFDLDEFAKHVANCLTCQRIYDAVYAEMKRAAREAGFLDDDDEGDGGAIAA